LVIVMSVIVTLAVFVSRTGERKKIKS